MGLPWEVPILGKCYQNQSWIIKFPLKSHMWDFLVPVFLQKWVLMAPFISQDWDKSVPVYSQ